MERGAVGGRQVAREVLTALADLLHTSTDALRRAGEVAARPQPGAHAFARGLPADAATVARPRASEGDAAARARVTALFYADDPA